MNTYTFEILPEKFVIAQLPPTGITQLKVANSNSLLAVIHTLDEITYIGPAETVPPDAKIEPGWRALKIAGTLDFSLVGVIAKLSNLLADAGVSIFALSTYSTDIILVKDQHLTKASVTLREAGCLIMESQG